MSEHDDSVEVEVDGVGPDGKPLLSLFGYTQRPDEDRKAFRKRAGNNRRQAEHQAKKRQARLAEKERTLRAKEKQLAKTEAKQKSVATLISQMETGRLSPENKKTIIEGYRAMILTDQRVPQIIETIFEAAGSSAGKDSEDQKFSAQEVIAARKLITDSMGLGAGIVSDPTKANAINITISGIGADEPEDNVIDGEVTRIDPPTINLSSSDDD